MALAYRNQFGLLTAGLYDTYIDHVMSLTPKQRNKWHVLIKDENGVGRRMYFDGCFKIKTNRDVLLVGAPSTVRVLEQNLGQHLPGLHPEHPGHGYAFQERIYENRTDNHYRNRYVRVPTAPGEPVRG